MNGNLQLFVLFAVAASSAFGAVSGAAPISPQAASNDLVVARRALGDGNWYTAEHRAENAAKLPALRTEARLQLHEPRLGSAHRGAARAAGDACAFG